MLNGRGEFNSGRIKSIIYFKDLLIDVSILSNKINLGWNVIIDC